MVRSLREGTTTPIFATSLSKKLTSMALTWAGLTFKANLSAPLAQPVHAQFDILVPVVACFSFDGQDALEAHLL